MYPGGNDPFVRKCRPTKHSIGAIGCIQDAALAPPWQGFCVPNGGRGSMVARRGRGFSAATSIAAGFGEVLHSCRAMQQQSAAVGLR